MPTSPIVKNQRDFTRTWAGRVYHNGVRLRRGSKVSSAWQRRFFPGGRYHYPYYRQNYVQGSVFISPFGFYFGIAAPFIEASRCRIFPPAVAYIDQPLYVGERWDGWQVYPGENWFNRPDLDEEPGLANAVDELTETFQNGDIDTLVALIDPNMSIAVYERGKYQYSMPSNDFVDLTRDMLNSTKTVAFSLNDLQERAPGVFCVSGSHRYENPDGNVQTTYVSFVLQDIGGNWTLTQVETAPGENRALW